MPDTNRKKTSKSIEWIARIFILALLFDSISTAQRPVQEDRHGRLTLQQSYGLSSRQDQFDEMGLGIDDVIDNPPEPDHYELTLNLPISIMDDPGFDQTLINGHIGDHGYGLTIDLLLALDRNNHAITHCDSYRTNYDDYSAAHTELDESELQQRFWPNFRTQVSNFRFWLDDYDTYGACVIQEGDNRAQTYFDTAIQLTEQLNEDITESLGGFSGREFFDINELLHIQIRNRAISFKVHYGPDADNNLIIKRFTFCYGLNFRPTNCSRPFIVPENVDEPEDHPMVIVPDIANLSLLPRDPEGILGDWEDARDENNNLIE